MLDTTEVRDYAAELSRLQGALLLQQAVPDAAQAEACFQQALAIARQQQAKSLGTARRHQPGAPVAVPGQARRRPTPCWRRCTRWFTEGFDTADLQEAKALLEELGG